MNYTYNIVDAYFSSANRIIKAWDWFCELDAFDGELSKYMEEFYDAVDGYTDWLMYVEIIISE